MARDGNTYAKRQRETLKRQKAAEKRERRQKRKEEPAASPFLAADPNDTGGETLNPPSPTHLGAI